MNTKVLILTTLISAPAMSEAIFNDKELLSFLTKDEQANIKEFRAKIALIKKMNPSLKYDDLVSLLKDYDEEDDLYLELMNDQIIQILDSSSTTETGGHICGVIGR